jgi:hypothetical protein
MPRTMLMVITLLVGCATGAVLREVVAPARAQGQAGPNYEYSVVEEQGVEIDKQTLSKYGQQGWRLVAVVRDANDYRNLYFERQAAPH